MGLNIQSGIEALAAYEVKEHAFLPDVDSDSWLLVHKKTGARVALLPKNDTNKVFYIAFRTPPEDSTGVAHIVEHTVLCGSRDFPVKDPFIELAKGSLNTFLNAITYPDKTVYPVASCNMQDFKNLMHVYLDAVFYPNIYREQNIFRQEGWHYEAESAESEITVNGVVYNEMKGALSSAEDSLARQINAALYPHTPYVHESGGDPVNIPDLTYEDYLEFHRRYYHPSNSYIFLYGDMDMAERLAWIDEAYLSGFDRLDLDSSIPAEPCFASPVETKCAYSILPEEDPAGKAYLSWNVAALPDGLDAGRNMAMKILNYALCDSEGAPVRKALRDKGLGEDVYSVFENGIRQPSYSIVSKFTDASRSGEFVSTIRETMEKIASEGINPRALEAGINYYEFRYREADFGAYPKGLVYGLNALDSWLYDDAKPFINLCIGDYFDFLRKEKDNGFFEKMIRDCFLDNPHCAVVVLEPEQGLSARLDEEMRARMQAFASKCTQKERQDIVDRLAALRAWQQEEDPEEDVRRIPLLSREDLTRKALPLVNELRKVPVAAPLKGIPAADPAAADGFGAKDAAATDLQIPVMTHPLSTSRIDYLTLLFEIRCLPEKYFRKLGLFRTLFSVLDTKSYSYTDLGHEINICTGGIGGLVAGYNWYAQPEEMEASADIQAAAKIWNSDSTADPGKTGPGYRVTFEVSVKTLHKNLGAAMELIREILLNTNYDMPERILEVLEEERAGMRAGMASAGHATAMQRALSYISGSAALMDIVSGLSSYRTLDRTCEDLKDPAKAQELCADLRDMADLIFRADNLLVDCTACEQDIPEVLEAAGKLAGTLHPAPAGLAKMKAEPFVPKLEKKNEGLTTAGQVQYVCRAGLYTGGGRRCTGAFRVLRVLMGYEYLWSRVRVEGGAYGCMSGFLRDGSAFLVSYRDPHLRRTIKTFEETAQFLRSFDADERTMTKYIIGAVSALDQPMTPPVFGKYSLSSFLTGVTDAYNQKERDQVLDAGPEDIRALADYLDAVMDGHCLCVVGSDAKLRENAELFGEIRKLV